MRYWQRMKVEGAGIGIPALLAPLKRRNPYSGAGSPDGVARCWSGAGSGVLPKAGVTENAAQNNID